MLSEASQATPAVPAPIEFPTALTPTELLALRGCLALTRGSYGYEDAEYDALVRWALTARLQATLVELVLAGSIAADVRDGRVLLGGGAIDVAAIVAGVYGAGSPDGIGCSEPAP